MRKKLFIITGIIVVVAAVVLGAYLMISNPNLKDKTLQSARWSYGGGMNGGHSSIEIKRDGENAIIVTEEQEWHNSDLTKVTYTVSADVMDELKNLIIKANVPRLEKRGMSKFFAYDADTYSFSCYFKDYDYYSVGQYQKKSAAESERLFAIRDYLYSLTKGEGVTEIIKGTAPDSN